MPFWFDFNSPVYNFKYDEFARRDPERTFERVHLELMFPESIKDLLQGVSPPFCFDDEIIDIAFDNVVKEVSEYDSHGPLLRSCVAPSQAFLSTKGITV